MIPAKKVFKVGDGQTEMGADYDKDQYKKVSEAIGKAIEDDLDSKLFYAFCGL